MNPEDRLQDRLQDRLRDRLKDRLRDPLGSMQSPCLCCTGAVFQGGSLCDKSMSVGDYAPGRLSSEDARRLATVAGLVAVSLLGDAGRSLVLLLVTLLLAVSVAFRVVAGRRLLASRTRLVVGPHSSGAAADAVAVVSYAAPSRLRRLAGRLAPARSRARRAARCLRSSQSAPTEHSASWPGMTTRSDGGLL